MARQLRILILEDRPEDVQLVKRELRRGGIAFTSRHVEDREGFAAALSEFQPDLVISDYSLPDYDGLRALMLVRGRDRHLPFILLSGLIGEERTIEAFGNGVTDVILKNNLVRLVHSVIRVIKEIDERSERQLLKQQLHALQQDFDRVTRATELSELAASIAHEVNQPLAAVVNFVEAARECLKADGESGDAVQLMEDASIQALRAGEIVSWLRTFLSRGGGEPAVLFAENLVRDAIRIALLDASAKGIHVIERFTAPEALVEADSIEIQQILVNLLRNAVDAIAAASPGRKCIEVEVTADEVQICVSITDTGAGVLPEVRDRMFEPFVTSKTHGLGIGLSISRRLAEANGGAISIADRPGGGAAAKLLLPRVFAEMSHAAPAGAEMRVH